MLKYLGREGKAWQNVLATCLFLCFSLRILIPKLSQSQKILPLLPDPQTLLRLSVESHYA